MVYVVMKIKTHLLRRIELYEVHRPVVWYKESILYWAVTVLSRPTMRQFVEPMEKRIQIFHSYPVIIGVTVDVSLVDLYKVLYFVKSNFFENYTNACFRRLH